MRPVIFLILSFLVFSNAYANQAQNPTNNIGVDLAKIYFKLKEVVSDFENRIADLETQTKSQTVYTFANGEIIGVYLYKFTPNTLEPAYDIILSDKKHIFTINQSTSQLQFQSIWYENSDCSGVGYTDTIAGLVNIPPTYIEEQGRVFASRWSEDSTAYLIPVGTAAVNQIPYSSELNGNGCVNLDEPETSHHNFVPIIENDPQITGVPNKPFTPPITLGF